MKKYLLTGLGILLPIVLTILVLVFLLRISTTPLLPWTDELVTWAQYYIPVTFPEAFRDLITRVIALIVLCLFIILLGMLAQQFVIRYLIQKGYDVLLRIPFVRAVIKVSRDLSTALFSQDGKRAFHRPVLVPFPYPPSYGIGFLVGGIPAECASHLNESMVSVFAPTAPHPISGFLLFVPKEDTRDLYMSNEEALKFLVSCGLLVPEPQMKSRLKTRIKKK